MHQVLLGAAAGTVATIPMTLVMTWLHATLPGETPRALPPREVAEGLAVKAGVSRHLSERDAQNLTLALHVGYGAATGALFGIVAPRRAGAAVAAGTVFGFGVWAASYLGWLRAAGVRQPVAYDPVARTGFMIAAHLMWGAATGALMALGTARREPASSRDPARA